MGNVHEGHRDRMRDKFLKSGLDSMASHEVLEFLLFHSVPRQDTNEIAHNLMKTFGSLPAVLDAPYEELIKVDGVSKVTATFIKFQLQLMRRYFSDKTELATPIKCVRDCGNYLLGRYIGYDNEIASVLCMDNKCNVLGFQIICEGDIGSAVFSSRKIIEAAIKYRATTAILAHNHPGGIALPSDEDIVATQGIKSALSYVGVLLLDHIIIADGDYVSLAESEEYKYLF